MQECKNIRITAVTSKKKKKVMDIPCSDGSTHCFLYQQLVVVPLKDSERQTSRGDKLTTSRAALVLSCFAYARCPVPFPLDTENKPRSPQLTQCTTQQSHQSATHCAETCTTSVEVLSKWTSTCIFRGSGRHTEKSKNYLSEKILGT